MGRMRLPFPSKPDEITTALPMQSWPLQIRYHEPVCQTHEDTLVHPLKRREGSKKIRVILAYNVYFCILILRNEYGNSSKDPEILRLQTEDINPQKKVTER